MKLLSMRVRRVMICVWLLWAVPGSMSMGFAQVVRQQRSPVGSVTPGSVFTSKKARLKIVDASAEEKSSVDVMCGKRRFTRYIPAGNGKPVFYPLTTPSGVAVTRSWPLEKNAQGRPIEGGVADDHPHHRSLWCAHEVNGFDFWTGKNGSIVVDEVLTGEDRLNTQSRWTTTHETVVCTEATCYHFGQLEAHGNRSGEANRYQANWLDAKIKLKSSQDVLHFKDTKEGFFAMRTHPDLRLRADPKRGVNEVFGHALNSAGDIDKGLWGRAARWVMYYGPVGGHPVSILMCDHPDNLRHPTTWHARDYGLVAANPFGLHDFLKLPIGAGGFTMARNQTLTLRYRVYFVDGIIDSDAADELFEVFAAGNQ